MIAIAQVDNRMTGICPLGATMLTGEHKGRTWALQRDTTLRVGEFILVQYEPEDQFANPIPLDEARDLLG